MRAALLTTAAVIAALVLWSTIRESERAELADPSQASSSPTPSTPDVAAAPAEPLGPAARATAPAEDPTYQPATGAPAREHVVAPGETLADIAARYYGDAARADEIYAANRDRIRDPAQLHGGQTLVIP